MQGAPPGFVPPFTTDAHRQASDALYQCVARADPHAWSVVVRGVGEAATAAWLGAHGPFWRAASVGQTWALLDGLARIGAYGLLATVAGRVCGTTGSELHGSTSVARLALLAVRLSPDSCVTVHTALALSAREAAGVVKAAAADGRRPLLPAHGPRSRDAQFLAECVAVLVATGDERFFDDAIFLLLCAVCTHAEGMQTVVSVMDDRFRAFRDDEAFYTHLKKRIEHSEVGTIRESAVDHQLWVRAGVRTGLERAIAYCPSGSGGGGSGSGSGDVVQRVCDMLLIEGGTPAVKLAQNEDAFTQALIAYTGMPEVAEYKLDALRTQVYGELKRAEDGSQMFHYTSGYSECHFRCPESVTVPAYPSLLSLFVNCHWREYQTASLTHLTTEQQTWVINCGYRDACDYYRE